MFLHCKTKSTPGYSLSETGSGDLGVDHHILRRVERSLFAQGHVKKICFYPVRYIPLRSISLKLTFSAPIRRIYPIFV